MWDTIRYRQYILHYPVQYVLNSVIIVNKLPTTRFCLFTDDSRSKCRMKYLRQYPSNQSVNDVERVSHSWRKTMRSFLCTTKHAPREIPGTNCLCQIIKNFLSVKVRKTFVSDTPPQSLNLRRLKFSHCHHLSSISEICQNQYHICVPFLTLEMLVEHTKSNFSNHHTPSNITPNYSPLLLFYREHRHQNNNRSPFTSNLILSLPHPKVISTQRPHFPPMIRLSLRYLCRYFVEKVSKCNHHNCKIQHKRI